MAHKICGRPFTIEAPVLFRTIPCDIIGKQSGIETSLTCGIVLNHQSIIRKYPYIYITFILSPKLQKLRN